MRSSVLGGLAALLLVSLPAVAEEDCRKPVEEAFAKQRQSKAYRVVVTNPSQDEGPEQVFEYLPPMTMYRKVSSPQWDMPQETVGFGNRAWIMENGSWFEMQPHYAQMLEDHMRGLFGAPVSIKTPYSCLGTVSFEGAEYTGYRTEPEKTNDGESVARTVYVEPKTGLPMFNVIASLSPDKPALVREAYTYPDDLKIEIPEGAPMVKNGH